MHHLNSSGLALCLLTALVATGCDREVDNAFSGDKSCSNGEVNVNGKCTPPQCAPGILWDKAACEKQGKGS